MLERQGNAAFHTMLASTGVDSSKYNSLGPRAIPPMKKLKMHSKAIVSKKSLSLKSHKDE